MEIKCYKKGHNSIRTYSVSARKFYACLFLDRQNDLFAQNVQAKKVHAKMRTPTKRTPKSCKLRVCTQRMSNTPILVLSAMLLQCDNKLDFKKVFFSFILFNIFI